MPGVDVAERVGTREIGVTFAQSLRVGATAPPQVGDVALSLAALGDLYNWVHSAPQPVAPQNYLVITRAQPGSLDSVLEAVQTLGGKVVETMADTLPTAVANFMACLQALQSVGFISFRLAETHPQYARKDVQALSSIITALATGVKRAGKIKVKAGDILIELQDVDFKDVG